MAPLSQNVGRFGEIVRISECGGKLCSRVERGIDEIPRYIWMLGNGHHEASICTRAFTAQLNSFTQFTPVMSYLLAYFGSQVSFFFSLLFFISFLQGDYSTLADL